MRISRSVVEPVSEMAIARKIGPMVLTDLVTHILYDTLERCGSLVSSIGRSFRDLQVKETGQRQVGWEWIRCLWWRLAEHRGLWQEKSGDDYPVVPVGAHGGRRESSEGKADRRNRTKFCDDVITRVRSGKRRDLLFIGVSPDTHPCDPSADWSQIGHRR